MKIANHMSPKPFTVPLEANIDQARALMIEHGVRHLPVMHEGKVAGLITDHDLRAAWLPAILTDLTVKDLMNPDPIRLPGEASIYEAARILHAKNLTGLLVMDGEELAGIVTLADMLGIFVQLLGLLQESTRLDVYIPREPGPEKVQAIIQENGGIIMSVALLTPKHPDNIYSFRLEGSNADNIVKALDEAGYQVSLA